MSYFCRHTFRPPTEPPVPTEAAVRAMRDAVYVVPCTDGGWAGCRENWMRPENVQWLRDRLPADFSPPHHQSNTTQ